MKVKRFCLAASYHTRFLLGDSSMQNAGSVFESSDKLQTPPHYSSQADPQENDLSDENFSPFGPFDMGSALVQLIPRESALGPLKTPQVVISIENKRDSLHHEKGKHSRVVVIPPENDPDGLIVLEQVLSALKLKESPNENSSDELIELSALSEFGKLFKNLTLQGCSFAGWNHRSITDELNEDFEVAEYPGDPLDPDQWTHEASYTLSASPQAAGKRIEPIPSKQNFPEPSKDISLWTIAVGNRYETPYLSEICKKYFNHDINELVVRNSRGEQKNRQIDGVFSGSVSIVLPDFKDPLRVVDFPIQILAKESTLVTVDPSGSSISQQALLELEHERTSSRLRGPGSIAIHLIDRILAQNARSLDSLERKIAAINELVEEDRLTGKELFKKVSVLRDTISYFDRKVEQVSYLLDQLREASESDEGLFQGRDFDSAEIPIKGRIASIRSRLGQQKQRLIDIREEYDTYQGAKRDIDIWRNTVAIGLTAPPIIADMLFGKENTFAMVTSVLVGIGLVIYGHFNKKP